jgi:GNAT superfamily N-acetyltransferase
MPFSIERLNENSRAQVLEHFLALPRSDLRSRFGASLSARALADWVEGIDFGRDAVFAVHDGARVVVGLANVCVADDRAEVGLSVLPRKRRRGSGSALFERAALHARSLGARCILMHFHGDNGPIMRIARKFDMTIVAAAGEAEACLELPPASVESIAGGRLMDARVRTEVTRRRQVAMPDCRDSLPDDPACNTGTTEPQRVRRIGVTAAPRGRSAAAGPRRLLLTGSRPPNARAPTLSWQLVRLA